MIENHQEKTDLEEIINEAYSLYMPQVRSEITEFYIFLNQHYGLTKKSDPYNILEIGTKFGGTFYLWCMMNKSTGLNISIDMDDGGRHGGIDEKKMDERDKWFNQRFANCKFIRGNSHSLETWNDLVAMVHGDHEELIHFIDKGRRKDWSAMHEPCIDFLFIDGDHTYEGVKQDFEMYRQFVKSGGIVAFHDIKNTQRHRDRQVEVEKFWNEITKVRMANDPEICMIDGQEYRVLEFSDPIFDWGGVGILITK